MAQALLLYTVRAGTLLNWVKREPSLLESDGRTETLGISGGLISLSVLAVSDRFETLYDACLETARLLVRLCKFISVKSRAMEDCPGAWGWAVLGILPDELRKCLDHFQQNMGIPSIKRAQVGVTGAGWSTIIGPPSVLELCINQCLTVKDLTKNPLNITALQHIISVSQTDLDYILGKPPKFLTRLSSSQKYRLWGMDDPEAMYTNWEELLRAVCSQVLSLPLDITQAIGKLKARLNRVESVRIIQIGSTSHVSYLASVLKAEGMQVLVEDEQAFHCATSEVWVSSSSPTNRVAIVGMAGRGPGCENVDDIWKHVMSKQDLCTEIPKDRFDLDEFFCLEHGRGDKECKMTTRYGCFMNKPGHFDSRFFHISPREAMLMDPGHRHFLMSTYEALEMAGYSDGQTKAVDSNRIAAFYGQCSDDWHEASHPALGCDAYTLQGVQRAFGPGRLAWHFKWEGPTYALDSACTSTVSSIHLACMSLLSKDIDMAVAGAGNILSFPHSFTSLSKSGVLSDTGNCKAYRDDADGYCRGDFVGAVVLKRLEDAVAHNDNILAVVAASGRNHSGNSTSITTSDPSAQERLFRRVMRNARVAPDDISYVEMHGTGTQIGDLAEMGAVTNVFKHRRRDNDPLVVGSVKSNFGHSEAASGMAELLKCIMMLQRNIIPPQAGMPHPLNPKFPDLQELNIEIPSEPREFKSTSAGFDHQPRRILLNNFDAAGGNACMILEDYRPGDRAIIDDKVAADPRSHHAIVISARTQASQDANKRNFLEWLRTNPSIRLEDLAYTTTARRMHHPFRFACTASTIQELITKLEANIKNSEKISASNLSSSSPPFIFVFTGQGSHYAGMGSELYSTSLVFQETVDLCVSICKEHHFPSFLDLVTKNDVDMKSKTTVQTQLAVLTLEIGLAAFWKSIGVLPSAVLGHSLGEYAALHVAGVLSLADALYLVGQRALLLLERCDMNAYSMLAVSMSAIAAQELLSSRSYYSSCRVACINSSSATVLSGSTDHIIRLRAEISVPSKTLPVPYGFHSFQMDSLLTEYTSLTNGVTYSAPQVPVASTLLGSTVDAQGTFDGHYLAQQMRQAVNFVGAINAISTKLSDPIWLELGPSQVCGSFIRATLSSSTSEKTVMSTLGGAGSKAWASISECLSVAYNFGVAIDWLAFHAPYKNFLKLLTLPAYSWDMKDYWISYKEPNTGGQGLSHPTTTLTKKTIISTCAQYVVKESSSADKVQVTLSASLADENFSALINGHQMQHMPICPGSVFCEAAYATAMYTLVSTGRREDAQVVKLALRDPVMSRPFTSSLVGSDGELLTTVTKESPSSNDILVSWQGSRLSSSTNKGTSFDLGSCRMRINRSVDLLQTSWDRISYFIKTRMDEVIRAARDGSGHRFRPDIFYALFASSVEYGTAYKCVKEAFISSDFSEAAAEVVLHDDPAGTKFVTSPYWGEGISHLAGFTVNCNPLNHKTAAGACFINGGFASFEQTVPFEIGKSYFSYVRVTQIDEDSRSCEIFVFNAESRLIARCSGVRFHKISNAVLGQVLSGKSRSPASHNQSSPKVVEEKVMLPVSKETTGTPKREYKTEVPPANGVIEVVLTSISQETGIDASEITDDTVIAELGVDSIMAIEVATRVSSATGLDLLPSFMIDHPTIGDLRRAFATTPSSTFSPASTPPKSDDQSQTDSPFSSNRSMDSSNEHVAKTNDALLAATQANKIHPAKIQEQIQKIDDSSPAPSVRITLLHGRSTPAGKSNTTPRPFYMIADGTGSMASYIHLPAHIKSKMPVYGIDSPFLRCPSRFTVRVGIPGAAKLIVEALLQKQPEETPFWIGGFSGGAMIAFEVCRQLSAAGRVIEGLLLIDMCSPRLTVVADDGEVGLAMFEAISAQDEPGVSDAADISQRHLRALIASVAAYNPPQLDGTQPPAKRTAMIWAEKGMIERCGHSSKLKQMLADRNIPTERYPGFLEDPRLGAVAWSLPHKAREDLGPNGWDRFVGRESLRCLSVPADHFEMPSPGYAHLLVEAMEMAFEYFREGSIG